MTAACTTPRSAARRRASARDFPILARTVRDGQPLVYLDSGATLAEAARRCSTPSATSTSRTTRPCTAARTSSPRRRPTAYEDARATVAAFVGAPPDEIVFDQERHRGASTSSPTASRNAAHGRRRRGRALPRSAPATRSSSPRWSTTPTSCPWQELCRAHRARRCAGSASTTTAASTSTTLGQLVTERTKVVAFTHVSPTSPGTVNAARGASPRAPTRSARSSCSTPASRCRTCRVDVAALGVDFLAFSGHKMLGPTGIGVLVGPQRAARRAAAVPHRRLDDRGRDAWRRTTFAAAAAALRGRPPPVAQAVGLGAAVRLPRRASAWSASRAHEHALDARCCLDGLAEIPGVRRHRPAPPGPRRRGRRFVGRRHPRRTTSARCSTPRASRCASATTAPGRCIARFGVTGHHPGDALPLQHRGRHRTPSSTASRTAQQFFGVRRDAARDALPGDHPGPLPQPARPRPARTPFDAEVAPRQPHLRRRGHRSASRVDGDVDDVSYEGQGCSISQASESVMTDLVIGRRRRRRARDAGRVPRPHAEAGAQVEPDEDLLEDAVAFAGVAKYPARVKCALLGWMALQGRGRCRRARHRREHHDDD